jgi:hypothetical protein
MSEVLRAILETACIDSRPAFYSVDAQSTIANTGARSFANRTASIQCKADCWFLAVGWSQDASYAPAGTYAWESRTFPGTFVIQRASTQEVFAIAPTSSAGSPTGPTWPVQSNTNYDLNNWVTLDEYVLFAPAELILIQETVLVTSIGAALADTFVTIAGIEYQFPPGKGAPSYGY